MRPYAGKRTAATLPLEGTSLQPRALQIKTVKNALTFSSYFLNLGLLIRKYARNIS